MFRRQVEEYKAAVAARDAISAELTKGHKELKRNKDQIMFKDDELQKKATLYQRTVEARREMHESYLRQKDVIKDVDERNRLQDEEWQELVAAAAQRDDRLVELRQQIDAANSRIDLLEQQKKMYMDEFRKKTNRPCGIFLQQFKKPTQGDVKKG
mmetsp:Transcript_50631/g.90933  ORF Transcript_50631/g.90933 Transcript_50631/m.90933 type:complete len:155 (-) Transcript_50631:122-586(-)